MLVREAIVADARSIAEVHVASWRVAYRGQVPDEYLAGLSVDDRESSWVQQLAHSGWPDGIVTLVVIDADETVDGRVVGFASVGRSRDQDAGPNTGELRAIYLEHSAWGRRFGQMLLGEAVQKLQDCGCRDATLWVLDSNARARRFYEAAGWHPEGVEKVDNSWGFSLREVRYRCHLERSGLTSGQRTPSL